MEEDAKKQAKDKEEKKENPTISITDHSQLPNAPSSLSSSSLAPPPPPVQQQQQPPQPLDHPTPMTLSTPPPPPSNPPSLNDLTIAPSSSSSSAEAEQEPEPELIQESKRIKQEDTPTPSSPTHPSSNPPTTTTPVSSIPSASQRPFYNPQSGRPPRPPPRPAQQLQQTDPTTGPQPNTTTSGLIGSAQPYSNPALVLLHKPEERARAKFRLERQKAKKGKADWVDPVTVARTRSGPSPLGPGPAPYDKVKEVVSDVKEHVNRLTAKKLASKKSNPVSSSSSSSSSDSDSEPGTVEEVIAKLDKYLEGVPSTVSAQEMEDKLVEFQVKVDVDPTPTWYALMKKSTLAFWDNLTDYFVCEALESDQEDDIVDDDDVDDSANKSASGSAPGSAST